MGDVTDIEQGIVVEQQPRPAIAGEVPIQKLSPQQRRQNEIQNFYQDKIARHKVEQTLLGQKAWVEIEKAAASKESPHHQEHERQIRPRSIMDKVHRQTLLMQARLEGIRDLGRFQGLADYFEATVYEHESKYVKVPKGLSDEQKKKVVEDWKARGWHGGTYPIHEYEGDKHASLSLSRGVLLRLGRDHVRMMKQLISADNDPVKLAEGLRTMGFRFSKYGLESPDEMKELGEFFTAPHAKEALKLAQGIFRWSSDWFASEGRYGDRPVEVGQ